MAAYIQSERGSPGGRAVAVLCISRARRLAAGGAPVPVAAGLLRRAAAGVFWAVLPACLGRCGCWRLHRAGAGAATMPAGLGASASTPRWPVSHRAEVAILVGWAQVAVLVGWRWALCGAPAVRGLPSPGAPRWWWAVVPVLVGGRCGRPAALEAAVHMRWLVVPVALAAVPALRAAAAGTRLQAGLPVHQRSPPGL